MTPAELRARASAVLARAGPPSLEMLLTGEDYFGLTTATPLQRAICRIASGRPLGEIADHPHVRASVGDVAALPRGRPKRILLLAGVRGAKSLTAGAAAIEASQICDVSTLKPGEVPRVSVVSVRKDLADVTHGHIVGALLAKPKLRALMLEPPTGDSVLLRHPTGRPIEVKVVAGAGAGSTLISRWSAGVIFDEAPRMVGASEGVVNLDDMLAAIQGRMLGPIWEIGSPWAPFGPVYRDVTEHEGHPTKDLVVIRARADWLNPMWWTEERMAELRDTNPTAYRTDVEARFADPEEALLPSAILDACTRTELVEAPRPRHEYVAAMDPATRGNAWTLVIGTRREGKRIVVKARQWIGSSVQPLDPEEVLQEIGAELRPYGLDTVETDQWSTDALRALARRYGLKLVEWPMTQAENTEAFLDFARRCASGEVVLPPDPAVRADLLRVKRRVTQNGLAIALPETSDGRHCDYAPAVVRCTRRYCAEAAKERTPETEAARTTREEAETMRRAQERFAPKSPSPTWRRRA